MCSPSDWSFERNRDFSPTILLSHGHLPPLSLTGGTTTWGILSHLLINVAVVAYMGYVPDGGEPAPIPLACICVLKPSAPIKYDLMQILLEDLHMQFFSSVAEQRWV